jgi:Flp pilus assembly protein TadD
VLVLGVPALHARPARESSVETSADLLALTPEMAEFLVDEVQFNRVRKLRLQGLIDAIFDKDGLGITYGNNRTKTARETFETRSGNCLSFTVLFVTMARHLGLNAYFQEVAEVMSWDQRGELVVSNKHMFAEVELDNGVSQVDFLPGAEKRYTLVRRINDQRALAHFFNNLGAEKLTGGNLPEAVKDFERSLAADDSFTPAMVNLAVAQRRLGAPAAAEENLLRALAIDGGEFSAASNLAGLYLAQGREEKARPYLAKVEKYLQQNPFHHYRQGLQDADRGNYEEAVKHLREAVRRLPEDPGFRVTLADYYIEVGARARAQSELTQALFLTRDVREKDKLRDRLAALEGQ